MNLVKNTGTDRVIDELRRALVLPSSMVGIGLGRPAWLQLLPFPIVSLTSA